MSATAASGVASALDAAVGWAMTSALAASPLPTPTPGFDTDTVTPGVWGFLITFAVAAAAVLLMVDMVRRVRRTRYREEIRAKLEAERQAGDDADGTPERRNEHD